MADNNSKHHAPFDDVTSSMDTVESGSVLANLDRYLWIYCSPWILILGLFGNILIIIVVKSRKAQNSSTTIYLPVLAIFDCCTIVAGIVPEWLDAMRIVTIKEVSGVTCKLEKFLFYVSADSATWMLVLFTIDRFIAVCFPLHKTRVCTPKCAKISCLTFFLLSVAKNFHVFWTRGPVYDPITQNLTSNCGQPEPFTHFEQYIRPWIAFVYANLIPFVIIIICNISIIHRLIQVQKMRRIQTNEQKSMKQTVLMCLSASFTFLIFITPSMALLIGKPYWTEDDDPNYAYDIAKAVNNQLVMVNHSINVILYCASGKKFREDVIALFKCRCCCGEATTSVWSSDDDKSKKLSKQPSNPNETMDTKRTTMSSLASTPTKDNANISQYGGSSPLSPVSPVQQNDIEIDLKEVANPVKDFTPLDSAFDEQTHERASEKDSGIGLKDGKHDLAKDTHGSTQSDYLSRKFEDELDGSGHRISSITNSSTYSVALRSQTDRTPTMEGVTLGSSGERLSNPTSAFVPIRDQNSHDNPAYSTSSKQPSSEETSQASEHAFDESSISSELANLTIVENETDDDQERLTPTQNGVLRLDNCTDDTEESSDTHASVSKHSQSGKLSPALKVVPMETTQF